MDQLEFGALEVPEGPASNWFERRVRLSQLFSPTAPIEEEALFAGRLDQISRLVDTVFQRGQHAIVYGERGVGKTSLMNTFAQKIFNNAVTTVRFYFVKCFQSDDYYDIWTRAFNNQIYPGTADFITDDIDSSFGPVALLEIIQRFSVQQRPVFVLDEFDRIIDISTKLAMAETIKLFSDEGPNATIIPVGIGRTITDLLAEHQSVARAIRQIEMPRMSETEIRELVSVRLDKVNMTIDAPALDKIVGLARGLPGYAHLIGLYSAYQAVDRRSKAVTSAHVRASVKVCIQEAGESIRRAYERATQSSKPNAKFVEALLACALADQNEFGSFKAAAVRDPLTQILGEYRDIPSFARHLSAFCSRERGPVLEQTGTQKNYKYHFIDPMMQSYVILQGINRGLIDYDGQGNLVVIRSNA